MESQQDLQKEKVAELQVDMKKVKAEEELVLVSQLPEDEKETKEDRQTPREEIEQETELAWPIISDNESFTSASSCSSRDALGDSTSVSTDFSQFWLIDGHPIMLSLIEQLEQERHLWDLQKFSFRNHKGRTESCERICNHLNAKFDLQLKSREMVQHVKKLRHLYNKEKCRREKDKDNSSGATSSTSTWYFERLSFLSKGLPVPVLNHKEHLTFIELYERCKGIWDMQDMSCRLRHVRQEAKEQLLNLCTNELKINFQPCQLERFIYRLRKNYQREKKKRLMPKNCKDYPNNEQEISTYAYYDHLKFLDQHLAPFKCWQCQQIINSVDAYKIHLANHNGTLPFDCPFCTRQFARMSSCSLHMRRQHLDQTDEQQQVICQDCGKHFACNSDLHTHRRQHTGEKPYCCHICGSRFRSLSYFARHKRRHEQRPCGKCHICGKSFFEQAVLNDHIKAHLNVRDKVCDVCQKTFTSSKYLRQHKEIHAQKKRYICKICCKGFAQYAGLSGHMKSHGTTVKEAGSATYKEQAKD
ncbi:uncharacterized protein Dwil_GK20069 [Drosophila willistoni]|uniref:Uncharacterized protein n=2 Tax=Drosophila willistoni TaxID=7260 RepID=B4MT09_DROWI|nr:uncharacterized protein Dwil_GK20069 [Drosophila willistoni]